MPSPAALLLAAALLPLAAFAVLVFVGRRMGGPLAGWVGTAAVAGSFACSLLALFAWYHPGTMIVAGVAEPLTWGYGKNPISLSARWIPVGPSAAGGTADHPGWLDVGIYIDSLTVAMFIMVTLVATLVHIFSLGYMRGDARYPRFFAYLGLFCFSMLGLLLGGTILQLFIFWELVGLCSYLLIGFWYEKKTATNAAIKAFVTNRVGDFGFLVGLGILFYHLGNVSLPQMWLALGDAGGGGAVALPGGATFSAGLLTVMGIGLFCGAVGKSAQFPLHVWLPDAMEGPTPVSALIHAATMVAAGVYLVGRIFPVLTPDAKLFIAVIGCTTLTMAALIAVVQTDIKRVLAYSTISQLGYMMLAMGVGSWVGGLFHLMTHAFFKALLFLGAGSVIYATDHEKELGQYGGLWRKIPWTAGTFAVGVLAIAGTPFFSGYYSKDMILTHAGAFASLAGGEGRSAWYWAFFALPTLVAYVTAFYMARCWVLTFWGEPRNLDVYDNAREEPVMWAPLFVLAVLAVFAGRWLTLPELLEGSVKESVSYVAVLANRDGETFYKDRPFAGFRTAWPADAPAPAPGDAGEEMTPSRAAHHAGERLVGWYVLPAFAVGIGLAFAVYWRGFSTARAMLRVRPVAWVHGWLYRRMYFDELYYGVFAAAVLFLSRLSGWIDRFLIDGLVNGAAHWVRGIAFGAGAGDRLVVDGAVNGVGGLAQGFGSAVRNPRSGRLRLYALALALAVTLGVLGAVAAVLAK